MFCKRCKRLSHLWRTERLNWTELTGAV